jgi:hypothetical protein
MAWELGAIAYAAALKVAPPYTIEEANPYLPRTWKWRAFRAGWRHEEHRSSTQKRSAPAVPATPPGLTKSK